MKDLLKKTTWKIKMNNNNTYMSLGRFSRQTVLLLVPRMLQIAYPTCSFEISTFRRAWLGRGGPQSPRGLRALTLFLGHSHLLQNRHQLMNNRNSCTRWIHVHVVWVHSCLKFVLVQRPRRVGAKFTGDDIKPDEQLQPQLSFDYDGKRDRWNNHID